jgi:large repetitive protein
MGTRAQRFSIGNWLTLIGVAAAASALAILMASVRVGATTSPILLTAGDPITAVEGNFVEDQVVAHFTDADNIVPSINVVQRAPLAVTCNDNDTYTASINWGDGSAAGTGTVSCSGPDTWEVAGSHTYKDSGTFNITVTVNDSDDATATGQTDTATISDADLEFDWSNAPDGPYIKVEGGSVQVQAAFFDNNRAFPESEGPAFDPGITTKINWGDGSAVQSVTPSNPPSACECFGDIGVSASHVYDAPKVAGTKYTITVTATDDGGSTASVTLTAEISDAALTAGAAKSFVAPGAQASTPVVASFTDAAGSQAAVGDFTATINWGDGSSSAGTLTHTAAGAFDVKGTHTYATAGTKSLTIKVDDEEGQTLSMTATATVPALPTTGHPQTPVQPSTPLVPLLALVFGLAIAVGGSGLIVARRIRH